MKKERAIFRPMTPEERERALALGQCTFTPATFSKRFAGTIAAQAKQSGTITDRQAARLLIQAYIYRRQMPAHLVPATPPPGYMTPRQRALAAELAATRANLNAKGGSRP